MAKTKLAARITVSAARRLHILDGDATGGGHGPGRGIKGKSEFPNPPLTDADVIKGVEDIANDPASYLGGVMPKSRGRHVAIGQIDGVDTRVIVDVVGRAVITAYPLNIPVNT